ncbi:MAG: aldehyde ferredoxin oxidoreductase family protein [Methanocellales archaeon]
MWEAKIADIDLSNGKIKVKNLDKKLAKNYLGGRGLGVKLLFDSIPPAIDPLSAENAIIFTVGPLTGIAPMSGRHAVISKSPLTNTIFDSSAGGFFGVELKHCGYASLIFKGMADSPVYIEIHNEDIDIKDGSKLWGLNVKETINILSKKGRVACIGRAGEKLIKLANIINDGNHACGRGGLGAVMGSKKLKAIIVNSSIDLSLKPMNEKKYRHAEAQALRLIKASQALTKGLAEYGTPALVNLMNHMRILPANNFRERGFTRAEEISGEYIKENFELERKSCAKCAIGCKRVIKNSNLSIPEYETIWAFGANLNNHDIRKIIEVNELCNDYGIDTISTGATLASYAELNNSEIKNLGELVKKVAEKKGVGEMLSEGSLAYCRAKEKPEASMTVKALEIPAYDPRGLCGQALAYATSNRGACHLRAYMVAMEILGKPKLIDRNTFTGKPALVALIQNLSAAVDSLILCRFSSLALTEEEYADLLSAAVGEEITSQDLLTTGERIWNLERLFNIREGFTCKDDKLPERFFSDGLSRKEFELALREYYEIRGWSAEGVPLLNKLKALQLQSEAEKCGMK